MSFSETAQSRAYTKTADLPLETIRGIAVLLLVSYHVVGPNANSGLEVAYPHPLRLMSGFLIDIRMPAFAFLAGFIYAIRPPALPQYGNFIKGKFWRIYVPGMIASALFLLVSHIIGTNFALPLSESWRIFFTSYAHFWFLQAIFVIFILFGLFDALTGERYTIWVLPLALYIFLERVFPGTGIMSWNGTTYLFVYFLIGVLCYRHLPLLQQFARPVSLTALVVLLACMAWNIGTLLETGSFSSSKRDFQSLGFGVGLCIFALLCLPRWPLLERIRPYALTIYLYHIFGTSAARRGLDAADIENIWLRWGIGMVAGVMLPIALHMVVSKCPPLSRYMLGK